MCGGCSKKAAEMAKIMNPNAEAPKDWPPPRQGINCYCGLFRLIPTGLKVDDIFELVSCPKCGSTFRGKYVGNGVEEVNG